MERRIFALGLMAASLAGLIAVAACSTRTEQQEAAAEAPQGWVMPPMIDGAQRTAQGLRLTGQVAPQGRVVVRGAGGAAYATGADDRGRFEIAVQTPAMDTLFVVETQNGQDAAPAPYRLLVTHDPAGPIALVGPGAPSRRLDPAGPLGSIDSDGRSVILSGRASAGAPVAVDVAGEQPITLRASSDGAWSATPPAAGAGGRAVSIGGVAYAYPGAQVANSDLAVERLGAGWSVTWAIPGGGHQVSWFPDRR